VTVRSLGPTRAGIRGPLRGELLSLHVDEMQAVAGVPISELPFPDGSAATMIVRGNDLIAPRGDTMLEPGNHVYVLCRRTPRNRMIYLMFGRPD